MARCSPSSPSWRAYLLPRIVRIMDDYGVDGIYIDAGYITNKAKEAMAEGNPLKKPAKDDVAAFEETAHHDAALTDLLALIYGEVKRRGGILKLHVDGALEPQTAGEKVYDYLWVGEGVGNADGLREAVKNHTPYVIPCIDMTFAKVDDEHDSYLHAIPYMQFPLFHAGKPFTGERGSIPGVKYVSQDDFWMKRCREIWAHYQAHPEGPHTYSGWDAFPGRSDARPKHFRWLQQYLPMVEEGTRAWLEIGKSNLFTTPPPKDVVASAFVNRESYLVLANYGHAAATIETTANYAAVEPTSAPSAKRWELPPRSLRILRRSKGAA
jgi:hypothetical protein